MEPKLIETALRYVDSDICVSKAKQKNADEYTYAIFFNRDQYHSYILDKYDSEDIIIWKQDGMYGFSYHVHYPSFRYDEPPSDEMVEYREKGKSKTYQCKSIEMIVCKIAEFILQQRTDEVMQCVTMSFRGE